MLEKRNEFHSRDGSRIFSRGQGGDFQKKTSKIFVFRSTKLIFRALLKD